MDYNEYLKLVDELNHHGYLYYTLGKPAISDSEYDELYQRLLGVEEKHPDWCVDYSPSVRVGGPLAEGFATVRHEIPMLSLQNGYDWGDIRAFDERMRQRVPSSELSYTAELKYDGVAVTLLYKNGLLTLGATRGNGFEGEEITANLKTVRNIPIKLESKGGGRGVPEFLEVRGEVFLPHERFDVINRNKEAKGESPFANPRNAVSGSLKLLDSKVTAQRQLEAVVYQLARWQGGESQAPHSQSELWEALADLGLPVPRYHTRGSLEEVADFYSQWQTDRAQLGYDVDGVVIKVDTFERQRELGSTAKSPRWAIAWKFAAQIGVTLLEGVRFQISRNGILTPVAQLKPVSIGGVLVRRSTLHNIAEMRRLGVAIGDYVRVKRAGDVIPKVVELVREKRSEQDLQPINIPQQCPECSSPTQSSEDGVFLYCTNPDCLGVARERLKFFVSKSGLDMEGVGQEWVVKFWQEGLIEDAADLFALSEKDLAHLERMGGKLSRNLIEAIQERKQLPFRIFLRGLGLPGVGETMAKALARYFGSWNKLSQATEAELQVMEGVGPVLAGNIVQWLNSQSMQKFVDKLRRNGVEILPESEADAFSGSKAEDRPLKGKKILFTGSLSLARDRAKEQVESSGGKVVFSLSKNTDYLVVGQNPGSKYQKALDLGVTILTEDEFRKLVEL